MSPKTLLSCRFNYLFFNYFLLILLFIFYINWFDYVFSFIRIIYFFTENLLFSDYCGAAGLGSLKLLHLI